ncbi:MAG: NAD(P)/FAD-dependent oxidoreductase, partial [Candidatus Zixiibacteriota bacterium]
RGSFSPRDGIADPGDMVNGFYEAANRAGVKVLTGENVIDIGLAGDTVTAVKTDKETFHTNLVVNAAGPQASKIAALAGYELDVKPIKRQIVVTGPLDYLNPEFPMIVDVTSGVYFHRETPGLLMGWADPATKPGYDESVDPAYTDEILMRTLGRIPRLEDAEIGGAWAGLYETTPDHQAVIGAAPGVNGMLLCNGFSGHGLMHAPAAGMVLADLLAGVAPRIDISKFSPERFSKGALAHEANVI